MAKASAATVAAAATVSRAAHKVGALETDSGPPMRTRSRARTRAKQRLREKRERTITKSSMATTPPNSTPTKPSKAGKMLKSMMMAAAAASIGVKADSPTSAGLMEGGFDPNDLRGGISSPGGRQQLHNIVASSSVPPAPKGFVNINGVRTVAGPAGMKAEIRDRSSCALADTLEAVLPLQHRQVTPLIPNDPNDSGVLAVRRKYPGRRPCIGDMVRLHPGSRVRSSLLEILQPGELAEIMDDSPELSHVPFHVKGPRGSLAFAGIDDIDVVVASSKTGRPAGTDAAYWLSRIDQLQEEWRERTAIEYRCKQRRVQQQDAPEPREEEATIMAGRRVQLGDGRMAIITHFAGAGWLTMRTADGDLLEAWFDPDGRPLAVQLAACPPLPLRSPFMPSKVQHQRPCALAAAVAANNPGEVQDEDSESLAGGSDHGSSSGYGSEAFAAPDSPGQEFQYGDSFSSCCPVSKCRSEIGAAYAAAGS